MILLHFSTIFIFFAPLYECIEDPFLRHLNLTDSYRKRIVDAHNTYRRMPNATDMKEISYDMALEEASKEWGRRCMFEHPGNLTGQGENLYVGPQSYSQVVIAAIQAWYNEVQYYSYNTSSCSSVSPGCGHYLQVVWADTITVGCSITQCGPQATSIPSGTYFIICRYRPAGVADLTERPYIAGSPPCSGCPDDIYECVERLCRAREQANTTQALATTDETTSPIQSTALSTTTENIVPTTDYDDLATTKDQVTVEILTTIETITEKVGTKSTTTDEQPATTNQVTPEILTTIETITETEGNESTTPDEQPTTPTTSCLTSASSCSEEYLALINEYKSHLQEWKITFDQYVSSTSGCD